MKLAAGIVNSDNVLASKPPIYTVNLLGSQSAVKTVKGDADVFTDAATFNSVRTGRHHH